MIEAMDTSIGKILDRLDELKLSDNTLVIFTSDNGGYSGVADNRPLRKGKGYLYEGGIRVPLIARWTNKIKPRQTCNVPVVSMDLYPTFLATAGIARTENEAQDGTDLLPLLLGEVEETGQDLYFHYPNYAFHQDNRLGSAIRSGDYKLIEFFDGSPAELYNLKQDLSEKKNLASSKPELVKQLSGKLQAWLKNTNAALPRKRD